MMTNCAIASGADSIGSVTQVAGNAQIQRGGATIPAAQGTPLMLHDRVTTPDGATTTLGFADGSSIALSANSSVTLEEATTADGKYVPSRVTLQTGSIDTMVPDKNGQTHRIVVDTANAQTTIRSPNY